MYLNINLIEQKGFNLLHVYCMQILKQNKFELLEDKIATYFSDSIFEKFEEKGILDSVKKKKKSDSDFSCLRLSKKGNYLLELFETPEITQGDIEMFDYLVAMYLKHEDEDRHIGNKKKTLLYTCQFRNLVGLTLHEMYWVCYLFLRDYPYTKKLENIFFDSNKNRYGKFVNNIEDSPLYQYYDTNKEAIEFYINLKNEKNN